MYSFACVGPLWCWLQTKLNTSIAWCEIVLFVLCLSRQFLLLLWRAIISVFLSLFTIWSRTNIWSHPWVDFTTDDGQKVTFWSVNDAWLSAVQTCEMFWQYPPLPRWKCAHVNGAFLLRDVLLPTNHHQPFWPASLKSAVSWDPISGDALRPTIWTIVIRGFPPLGREVSRLRDVASLQGIKWALARTDWPANCTSWSEWKILFHLFFSLSGKAEYTHRQLVTLLPQFRFTQQRVGHWRGNCDWGKRLKPHLDKNSQKKCFVCWTKRPKLLICLGCSQERFFWEIFQNFCFTLCTRAGRRGSDARFFPVSSRFLVKFCPDRRPIPMELKVTSWGVKPKIPLNMEMLVSLQICCLVKFEETGFQHGFVV